MEKLDFNFVREHIFAYQDKLNRPLNMLEKLNSRMNELAKDITRNEIISPDVNSPTRNSIGIRSITCDDNLITSRVQQSIYAHILHFKLVSWYSEKYNINAELMSDEVNWKSFKLARKESRFGTNIFISKWLSDDTATGKLMVMRKQRINASCPRCM